MEINEPNYFTTGELAAMFGISKQTLLYYDKVGILSPEFISDNGYRHYSISQYLTLEIIVNLRNLNISISGIKEFLASRTKNGLRRLLAEKDKECAAIIAENERIRKALDIISVNLEHDYRPLLNRITLAYRQAELLRLTPITEEMSGKDKIVSYARHTRKTFHNKGILEKKIGWIISCGDFFSSDQKLSSKAYFSYAPNVPGHKRVVKYTLREGYYLELCFEGPFFSKAKSLAEKMKDFMERNELYPAGDIFVAPLQTHWFTENPNEYINKIFFQVEYK